MIFAFPVTANEIPKPNEIDVKKYEDLFYKSLEEGKYVVFEQTLKKEDVIFRSVSFNYSVQCKSATTTFEAKLTRVIPATGELAALGGDIVAVMVNLTHKANGEIEVSPVLGSADMVGNLTSGSMPATPAQDALACAL